MVMWLIGCISCSLSEGRKDDSINKTSKEDADGDGFASIESGGLDCDDEDDLVYPEAIEGCDGKDRDCDGKIAETCGEIQVWEQVGRVIVAGMSQETEAALVEDVTGDGRADLLQPFRDQEYGPRYSSVYGVLIFDEYENMYTNIFEAEFGLYSDDFVIFSSKSYDGGDINGDGMNDLLNKDKYYGFLIFFGYFCCDLYNPFDTDIDDNHDGTPGTVSPLEGFDSVVSGHDYDGDGRDDIIAAAPGGVTQSGIDTSIHIFWGTLDRITGMTGQDPGILVHLDDLDGDGIDELGDTNGYWFAGDDLRTLSLVPYTDIYAGHWSTAGEPDAPWMTGMASVGDWSGDGYNDLLLSAASANTVWLMTTAAQGDVGMDGAVASMVGESRGGLLGAEMTVGELDGEAGQEALIYARGSGTTYVVTGGRLEAGLGQVAEEVCYRVGGVRPFAETADFTGDGIEDWVGTQASEPMDTLLFPGWAIPWGAW